MDIKNIRKNYRLKSLDKSDLEPSPIEMFKKWFHEAVECKIKEPNALALATASGEGIPSCRTVLLKGFDDQGFIFFTNYESHKGQNIRENPSATMVFFWKELERQVIINGEISKVSKEESEVYFASRPRESQIGAWSSKQGTVITSRDEMEAEFAAISEKFKGKTIPLPPFWGGFRLTPCRMEFWQGRENRLHDRFSYWKEGQGWRIERLSP